MTAVGCINMREIFLRTSSSSNYWLEHNNNIEQKNISSKRFNRFI